VLHVIPVCRTASSRTFSSASAMFCA
jgi:hypothetical protein